MGLIATIQRWRYIYTWRLRYWWMDTASGMHARLCLSVISGIAGVIWAVMLLIRPTRPVRAEEPHQAIIWFVVWLIVALLIAVAAYMMTGRPKPPAAQQGDTPTTDDGQSVKHHFGTCWVDDSFLLAWKLMGRSAIKSKGGK